jgi:ABC-2 type transport system ATP-binding protein
MSTSTVISAQNIHKQFRSRGNRNLLTGMWRPEWFYTDAVKNVSFKINRGESVAFLGPNGAGKTTTTKLLTGLIYPTSGKLRVLGFDPSERPTDYLRRIGLVMGNKAGLNWDLTAEQSFWLLKHIYEIDDDAYHSRVAKLSDMLEVGHRLNEQVRKLSLGERMKLELIGAILHEPDILFLDEPTIGLDIASKKTVRMFLRTLQRDHETTILLTSHDMDDVAEVCDRVLIISGGSIVHDGDKDELMRHYQNYRYLRIYFRDSVPTASLNPYGEVLDDTNGVLLKVSAENLGDALADITQKFQLDDITIESTPLERIIGDIFKKSSTKEQPK